MKWCYNGKKGKDIDGVKEWVSVFLLIFIGFLYLLINYGNYCMGMGIGGVYSLYLNIIGVELLIFRKIWREGRILGFMGGILLLLFCCGCFFLILLLLLVFVFDCIYYFIIVDDFFCICLLIFFVLWYFFFLCFLVSYL